MFGPEGISGTLPLGNDAGGEADSKKGVSLPMPMWSVVIVRGAFETQAEACRFMEGYGQLDPEHVQGMEVVPADAASLVLEVAGVEARRGASPNEP